MSVRRQIHLRKSRRQATDNLLAFHGHSASRFALNAPKRNPLFVSPAFLVTVIIGLFVGLILVVVIPNLINAHASGGGYPRPCIEIMRELQSGKDEWALENEKTNGVIATENDIKPYVKWDSNGNLPKCPQGGIYTIGKVGEPVTCSLGKTNANHVLP
jgi:hypothetical protein